MEVDDGERGCTRIKRTFDLLSLTLTHSAKLIQVLHPTFTRCNVRSYLHKLIGVAFCS